MANCKHSNFHANVSVGRIIAEGASDDSQPIAFSADVTVKCLDCGKPFEWIGLPMGYSPMQPMCSVDGLEARMPLKPQGEATRTDLAGFAVKVIRDEDEPHEVERAC